MIAGALKALQVLPNAILNGYRTTAPSWFLLPVFQVLCLLGVLFILSRHKEPGEIAFWFLLFASLIASSAVVYFDDGKRILIASYPLTVVFLTMGLTGQSVAPSTLMTTRSLNIVGVFTIAVLAAICLAGPLVATKLRNSC